jgi:hypothetical protein
MDDGRKDDAGKPRLDLVSPEALLEIGKVLAHGAAKYGADNWKMVENGRDRYYAAALRHLLAWKTGERLDGESGFSHLAHAATCLLFLMGLGADGGKTAGKPVKPGGAGEAGAPAMDAPPLAPIGNPGDYDWRPGIERRRNPWPPEKSRPGEPLVTWVGTGPRAGQETIGESVWKMRRKKAFTG